jgi:hypothetical protein
MGLRFAVVGGVLAAAVVTSAFADVPASQVVNKSAEILAFVNAHAGGAVSDSIAQCKTLVKTAIEVEKSKIAGPGKWYEAATNCKYFAEMACDMYGSDAPADQCKLLKGMTPSRQK